MANIGHLPSATSVWQASTASHKLTVRSYGKSGLHLDMETDPQTGSFRTLLLKSKSQTLAEYSWVGQFNLVPGTFSPATLPYINAFLDGAGEVKRDWRAVKSGAKTPDLIYRLIPTPSAYVLNGKWTLIEKAGMVASVTGGTAKQAAAAATPSKAKQQAKVDAAKQAAAAAKGTVIHTSPGFAGIATHQAPGSGVTTATFTGPVVAPTTPVSSPATTPGWGLTDVTEENHGPALVAEVETPVKVEQPKVKDGVLVLPTGWVGIDRNGETLAIEQAVIDEFTAAVATRRAFAKPHFALFVGPTGGGKTEGAIAMAEREGYKVRVVDCSAFETASDVYGAVEPDEKTGAWVRKPSTLWLALEEAAADEDTQFCIILDELTRAKVAAMNAFIAPLHNSAVLTNSVTGAKVIVGPNVFIAATANIGAAYSGTEVLDAALASRFAVRLNVAYLPREVEQAIIEQTGLPQAESELLSRLAEGLRADALKQPFRTALVPGTRDIVGVARQAMHSPNGVKGAWSVGVIARFSDEGKDFAKTERARAAFASSLIFPPSPISEDEAELQRKREEQGL